MHKLEAIFEGKHYILSSKLQAEWERLPTLESRFGDLNGKVAELNLPLSAMREIAERDYDDFLGIYFKLTGLKPTTS